MQRTHPGNRERYLRETAMRPSHPLLTASLLLALTLPTLGQPTHESPRPAMAVTVAEVRSVDWPETLTARGEILPWQEVLVSAQLSGAVVDQVLVEAGDTVRRGAVLARLDDRGLQAELQQAQASLAQAQASAGLASLNRDRVLALRNSGAVSEETVQQAVADALSAQAQRDSAQAALRLASLKLSHAVITAPDAGLVTLRTARVGQAVNVGTELFRLQRQSRLEWRAQVPATALFRVKEGHTARITLPDGNVIPGRVRRVSPTIDESSRLGTVLIALDASPTARAAMLVEGTIELNRSKAQVVPAASVVVRDGRSQVFVLEGSVVRRQEVKVGRRAEGEIELLSSLREGAVVVVRGAGFLADGNKVAVVQPASAEPRAGGRP